MPFESDKQRRFFHANKTRKGRAKSRRLGKKPPLMKVVKEMIAADKAAS